jgi:nucleotide-binding universal stress UspA family protein
MYKRVAISTDGSELAQRGVDHGLALARAVGASVVFVVVSEILTGMVLEGEPPTGLFAGTTSLRQASEAAARKILQRMEESSRKASVPCDLVHVRDKVPADGILETAASHDCDLIVMSSHGARGIERLLLGSQASEVVARAKIPVLIVK